MTGKTGSSNPWQPLLGSPAERRALLGGLLRLRRADLGYRHVPAFVRARNINTRMVGDIEHGRRDTYTLPTLRDDVAVAYEVTYESMIAVAWSDAGELVPAEAVPPAAVPAGQERPPMPAAQADADRPWYDPINERRFALAARGILDPTGAQMFPDDPDDARAWDGIGARMSVGDRVWFIADLHRLAAARRAGPHHSTGTNGSLCRGYFAGPGLARRPQAVPSVVIEYKPRNACARSRDWHTTEP